MKEPGVIPCLFSRQLPKEVLLPPVVEASLALPDGVTVALAVIALNLSVIGFFRVLSSPAVKAIVFSRRPGCW